MLMNRLLNRVCSKSRYHRSGERQGEGDHPLVDARLHGEWCRRSSCCWIQNLLANIGVIPATT